MKQKFPLIFLIVILCNLSLYAQTTKDITLSSGDGWYRLIEGNRRECAKLNLEVIRLLI